MAFIAHRCLDCGHTANAHMAEHDPDAAAAGRHCHACTKCPKFNPNPQPEIIPTWGRFGKPATTLVRPGENWNPDSPRHKVTTCACDACVALYEAQAGAVA